MKEKNSGSEKQQRFKSCFEQYSRLVYSVAFGFMKNRADANDIMQEVFLKFYNEMDRLTDEEHIKPWLITVAANTSRNALRSGWFSKTVFGEISEEPAYNEDFGEKSDLFDAVMSLPEKERIPLHLFYYEGCSTAEISRLIHVKESTVRVRLMRGRQKLKRILREEKV